jgi:peptidoglycan glycosyltransferase
VNKQLKRVSTVTLLMFIALFVSTSVIQVFSVDNLKSDARNSRTLYASYSAQRGPILVDGDEIASSKAVDDNFKYQRVYSDARLYAPVTGYFTLNQGTTGIEGALNDYLSGSANAQFFDQISSIVSGQDPKGAAVSLTIDPDVQKAAYDALGDNNGSVVAIDPKTGKILAMVSKHSYDPNDLAGHNTTDVIARYKELLANANKPLVNRAISGDLYHPGSTFKLIMTAAALESGKYDENSEFPNPATLTLPQSTSVINNAEGGSCGGGDTATIATALRLSCNIPMAELGQALGYQAIDDQAKKFGFDQTITVPMKATPSVFPQTESDAQLMLQSFGQGNVRVTPLQMAMVSAAVANGGTEMQPTLVNQIIAPDLSVIKDFEPTVFGNPISAQTAATMNGMMVQDVANGAASNATISGVDVAGKTGTAENGTGEPYTLWFTGFAPATNPEVAIAVVVENGGGLGQSGFGNLVAAPIAKKVLEAVLNK